MNYKIFLDERKKYKTPSFNSKAKGLLDVIVSIQKEYKVINLTK
jgi:hypothetical protein